MLAESPGQGREARDLAAVSHDIAFIVGFDTYSGAGSAQHLRRGQQHIMLKACVRLISLRERVLFIIIML